MITISYNDNKEIMEIENNGKVVYNGYYDDFKTEPHDLKKFLEKLNLDVDLIDSYQDEEEETDNIYDEYDDND